MKRYRSLLIPAAAALSVFCLVFLAAATEIPAMGQTGFHLATPSQARPADAEDKTSETEAEKTEDGSEHAVPQTVQLPVATGSNSEPLEVVKIIAVPSNLVIEAEAGRAEEMISQAFQKDPTCKSAVVRMLDGSRRVFSIEYDYDSLNEAETGLVMLPGTIVPPDGCTISPELAETELPILLYHPESPCELPVASAEPLSNTQILLPEHAVLDDLLQGIKSKDSVYYILEGGLTWSAEISWNLDTVDFGTPGTYRITAQPVLPDGIFLPAGLPELACDIIIQPDDGFLLGPPEFTGLYMISQWTKETPDLDKFRCFYAVGDGPWVEDAGQDLLSIPRFSPQSLQVFYYEDVFFDTPYYFQLAYDGEYSNILKVYFSEGQIHYRFYDGDRDGGDRGDQTVPGVSLPVPPETIVPETSAPESSAPESSAPESSAPGSSAPESSAPEISDTGETQPAEPPSSGHSSDHGSSGSGNSRNHGSSSGYRGLSQEDYVSAGPGLDSPTAPPPESKPVAALEEDTADYTVYSGRRLQKYRELNPNRPLLVAKHRIQVDIPLEDNIFSRLEDSSLLRVEILSLSGDSIRIGLYIDGIAVSFDQLPELTVIMPYPAAEESTALQVVDANSTVLTTAQPIDRTHITFTTNRTGTFQIQEALIAGTISTSDAGYALTEHASAEHAPAEHTPDEHTLPKHALPETTPDETAAASPLPSNAPETGASASPESTRQARSFLIPAVLTALSLLVLSGLWYTRRIRHSNEKGKGGNQS